MSVALREKLEKRNTAITAARALSEKAESEKRGMTGDETRQYDAHMAEAITLREDIDRRQKLIDEERRELGIRLENEQRGNLAPEAELRASAFRNLLRTGGLSSDELRSLTAGSETQGGFLNAPQEFVQQLIARVKNDVFIEALSTSHTTTNANGLGYPTLEDDIDDFSMITEIKSAPEDNSISFGKREFKPHPTSKLVKISDAFLRADGMNPEAIVLDRAAYKFGVLKENKYLLGSGNQEPLGLFTASAKGINTDRDVSTDMAVDNFTADVFTTVKYSLKAPYMASASWLFHRDAVSKIAKLKDGNGQYIFEMAEALGAKDNLKGRPLLMSEYVPNTFTANKYVGLFGDLKWYYTVNSLSLRVKRLNELFAANRQVGFLFDGEFDGMPVLSEAFARIKTAAQ